MNNENDPSNTVNDPQAGLESLNVVKQAVVDFVKELPKMSVIQAMSEVEMLFATAFVAQTHLHPVTNRVEYLLAKQLVDTLEEVEEMLEKAESKSNKLKELIEMYDLSNAQ